MVEKISGVILAGGRGRRLHGLMKPKILIQGEAIISRIISVIRDLFDEIIIVTNNPEEFMDFDLCKIVKDVISNAGPLGGLHAAMKNSSGNAIFVFAGDMPFLDKAIIKEMKEVYKNSDYDALIPRIDGEIEPLHAIYSTSLSETLETFVNNDNGRAVRDFIKLLNVQYHDIAVTEKNKRAFTNINSATDIKLAGGTEG